MLLHQIGDALEQARLVDLIGQLGDDDRLPALTFHVLKMRARPDRQPAATGLVGV